MSEGDMGVPVEKNIIEDVEMLEDDKSDDQGFDTSDDDQPFSTAPLKIDWLNVSSYGLPGQLGISNLPGCRFGDVWRKLQPDIDDLKTSGFTDMLLLCTKSELIHYRVPSLLLEYTTAGFGVHHFPIEDEIETGQILQILQHLGALLASGRKVLLHCYGGLGRSCLLAACLLLQLDPGMASQAAIETLRALRGHKAIETVKQYNFVNDFRKLTEEYQENPQGDGEVRSVSR